MKLILINNKLKDTDVGYSVEIDVSTNTVIKEVIQTIDPINPISYKNTFTKTVTLWSTPAVNEFFNSINRIDAVYSQNNINLSVKNSFVLHNDYNIVQQGYFVIDSMTYDKFNIRLFGDFGKVMYLLSNGDYVPAAYSNNDPVNGVLVNPNAGTNVMLKNLNINFVDSGGSAKTYTIDRNLVKACFDKYDNGVYCTYNDYSTLDDNGNPKPQTEGVITFIPTYQGKYQFFDNKVSYALTATGAYTEIKKLNNLIAIDGELVYTEADGDIDENNRTFFTNVAMFEDAYSNFNELVFGDYRSYYQRPAVKCKFILNTIFDYIKGLGYDIKLDSDFFNDSVPYYSHLWTVLDNLPIMEREEYDANNTSDVSVFNSNMTDALTNLELTRFVFLINGGAMTAGGYTHETVPYYVFDRSFWNRDMSHASSNAVRYIVNPSNFEIESYIDLTSESGDTLFISYLPNISITFRASQQSVYNNPTRVTTVNNRWLDPMQYRCMNGGNDNLIVEFRQSDDGINYNDIAFTTIVSLRDLIKFTDDGYVYVVDTDGNLSTPNDTRLVALNQNIGIGTVIETVKISNKKTVVSIRPENPSKFAVAFYSDGVGRNRIIVNSTDQTRNNPITNVDVNNQTSQMLVYQPSLSMTFNCYTSTAIQSDSVRSGSTIYWSTVCRSTNTIFDFLVGYCKIFGLVPYCDNRGSFIIDTRNNFYKAIDGSDNYKLDDLVIKDDTYSINPIPFTFTNFQMNFEDTDGQIEKLYKAKTNSNYGDITVLTQNNNTNSVREAFDTIFSRAIRGMKSGFGYNVRLFPPQNKELLFNYTDSNDKSNANFQLVYILGNINTNVKSLPEDIGYNFVISDDDNFQRNKGYRFFDFSSSVPENYPYAIKTDTIPNYSLEFNNNFSLMFGEPIVPYGDTIIQQYTIYDKCHKAYYEDLFNPETRLITANLYLNDSIAVDINKKIFTLFGRLVNIFKVHDYQWGKAGVYKCEMISINNVANYTEGQNLQACWIIISFNGRQILPSFNPPNNTITINRFLPNCSLPLSGGTIVLDLTIHCAEYSNENITECTLAMDKTPTDSTTLTITYPSATTSYRFSFDNYGVYNGVGSPSFFGTINGIVGAMNTFRSTIRVLSNGLWSVVEPTTGDSTATPATYDNKLKINGADVLSEYPYPTDLDCVFTVDTSKYGYIRSDYQYDVYNVPIQSVYNTSWTIDTVLQCNETITVDTLLYDVTTNNSFTISCNDGRLDVILVDGTNYTMSVTSANPHSLVIPNVFQSYRLSPINPDPTFSWYNITNVDGSIVNYINSYPYPNHDESPIYYSSSTAIPNSVMCVFNSLYAIVDLANANRIETITNIIWSDYTEDLVNQYGSDEFNGNNDYVFDTNTTNIVSYEQTKLNFTICDYPLNIPNSGLDSLSGDSDYDTVPSYLTSYPSNSLSITRDEDLVYPLQQVIDGYSMVLLFNNFKSNGWLSLTIERNGDPIKNMTFPTDSDYCAFYIASPEVNDVYILVLASSTVTMTPSMFLKLYGEETTNFSSGAYYQPCTTPHEEGTLIINVTAGSRLGLGLDQINNPLSRVMVTLFDTNLNIISTEPSQGAGTYTYNNLDSTKHYRFGVSFQDGGNQYISYVNDTRDGYNWNGTYTVSFNEIMTTTVPNTSVIIHGSISSSGVYSVYDDASYSSVQAVSSVGTNAQLMQWGNVVTPSDVATAINVPTNPRYIGTAYFSTGDSYMMCVLDPTTLQPQTVLKGTFPYGYVEDNRGYAYGNWGLYDYTTDVIIFDQPSYNSNGGEQRIYSSSGVLAQGNKLYSLTCIDYNNTALSSINAFAPKYTLNGCKIMGYYRPNYNTADIRYLCTYNVLQLTQYNYRYPSRESWANITNPNALMFSFWSVPPYNYMQTPYGWSELNSAVGKRIGKLNIPLHRNYYNDVAWNVDDNAVTIIGLPASVNANPQRGVMWGKLTDGTMVSSAYSSFSYDYVYKVYGLRNESGNTNSNLAAVPPYPLTYNTTTMTDNVINGCYVGYRTFWDMSPYFRPSGLVTMVASIPPRLPQYINNIPESAANTYNGSLSFRNIYFTFITGTTLNGSGLVYVNAANSQYFPY